MKLITNATTNYKTRKMLDQFGYEGGIMYLSPDKIADGVHTLCPNSTPGCRASCLNTSGRARIKGALQATNLSRSWIHKARINKSLLWLNDRPAFFEILIKNLNSLVRKANKNNKKAVVRLNGTSDIHWETIKALDNKSVIELFPQIQFYDYTKAHHRLFNKMNNYYLTYSYSELTTKKEFRALINNGNTVSVVFRKEIPETFLGVRVVWGDYHDFRFRDAEGVVVGLTAKGRAKKDTTGFVIGEM